MAIDDHNTTTGALARTAPADNTMGYVVGAVLVAGFIAMMLYFAYGDRISTSSTVTSPPATNTQTTLPRTATPPASTTPTTTPATPEPTPSTK